MKINKNYVIKDVLDTYVLINNSVNSNQIMKLNEISKDIFEFIKEGKSKEEIIELLFNKYDAPKEQIKKDTEEFINDLISKGIVENG